MPIVYRPVRNGEKAVLATAQAFADERQNNFLQFVKAPEEMADVNTAVQRKF